MSKIWKYGIVSIGMVLFSVELEAHQLNIKVESKSNKPLANIVVFVEPEDKSLVEKHHSAKQLKASVDQLNRQFVPHISVVQRSTNVDFPNSDNIKHHVYSFSPAKSFEIKLYDDQKASPILFDKTGEVTLGCNIHDWMLGYVYVVDTPWFGKTDEQGKLSLDLPTGKYKLKIWHPLLQGSDANYAQRVDIPANSTHVVSLKDEMSPAHSAYEEDDELDGY